MHAAFHGVATRFHQWPKKLRSGRSPEPLASGWRSRGSATMQVPTCLAAQCLAKLVLFLLASSDPAKWLQGGRLWLKTPGPELAAVRIRAQQAREVLDTCRTYFWG